MTIKSRTFGDMRIVLSEGDREKELTEEEFSMLAARQTMNEKFMEFLKHKPSISLLFHSFMVYKKFMISKLFKKGTPGHTYWRSLFEKEIRSWLDKHEILRQSRLYSFIKMKPDKITIYFGDKKAILYNEGDPFFEIMNVINQVYVQNQYCASERNVKDKVVVDAGTGYGDFAILCHLLGAKKIIAFDPLDRKYSALIKNIVINKVDNCTIMKRYLGNEDNEQKNMSKIDTICPIVNFIKMDVEGAERVILEGARATMKFQKPVLSFSAYHLPDDKEVLPRIVKEANPDYIIKLNSYLEEDFYCD